MVKYRRKYTDRESFIDFCAKKYNGKYDYSEFVYNGKLVEGIIICPKHGIFKQTPNVHAADKTKYGCPECSKERKTFDDFVNKARKLHGDKYDYFESEFVNMKTKTKIFCNKHECYFYQTPNNHTNKTNPNGCKLCAIEKQKSKQTTDFETFVQKSREVHGDKYEYNKETYIKLGEKTLIYCKKCKQWFKQNAYSHTKGKGCPKCRNSHIETIASNFLNNIKVKFETQKTFPWLLTKMKTHQYIDIFLTDNNIAIELDGEQHFRPIDFSFKHNKEKAEEFFKKTIERDKNKEKLCFENDIKLYRISYDEDIISKLEKILKENNVI